jgi:uncharacterized protein (TIGR03085 family)
VSTTRNERAAMSDTFLAVGPDAPTLCGDWTANDLLAHLLVRERRPDAAGGILVPALAKRTQKVMDQVAEGDYAANVQTFRSGPPLWSPFAVPLLGDRANLFEFFIHHEDLRRAQPEWEPRADDGSRDDDLWGALKTMGKLLLRKSPVGVTFRSAGRDDVVVKKAERGVIIVGLPGEIALVAFGRSPELARVVIQGDAADIAAFEAAPKGI